MSGEVVPEGPDEQRHRLGPILLVLGAIKVSEKASLRGS